MQPSTEICNLDPEVRRIRRAVLGRVQVELPTDLKLKPRSWLRRHIWPRNRREADHIAMKHVGLIGVIGH